MCIASVNYTILCAAVLFAGAHAAQAQTSPPNILLIIADDLGNDQIGVYAADLGLPNLDWTPNIDALASQGTRFAHCWASPTCSPSRAAIHTGMHALQTSQTNEPRHGVDTTIVGASKTSCGSLPPAQAKGTPLDQNLMTLPKTLSAAGYETALFGKWHLDNELVRSPMTTQEWGPLAHGWGEYSGMLASGVNSYTQWVKHYGTAPIGTTGMPPRSGLTCEIPVEDYSTVVIADEAEAWMTSSNRTTPWFCCVSFNAPHSPFEKPPDSLLDKTKAFAGSSACDPLPIYQQMVEAMDTKIGDLWNAVSNTNTIVIFCADNGSPPEVAQPPHYIGAGDTIQYHSRTKGTPFEGGVRVPLIIRLPNGSVASRRTDLVHLVDLFATISDYAGVTSIPANLPSRSLRSAVGGGSGPGRNIVITDVGSVNLEGFCGGGCAGTPRLPVADLMITHGFMTARDDTYKLIQYVMDAMGNPTPPATRSCLGLSYSAQTEITGPNSLNGELLLDMRTVPPTPISTNQGQSTFKPYRQLRDALQIHRYGTPGGIWPPRA